MMNDDIIVEGATANNLHNISVTIPKHRITVVTGVSGCGKSSLVFSTLAAESQRNVNRTYSAYIQQLLPKFDPPHVTRIGNLPFSIVVTQRPITGNARSTVGTYSDVYTALRLLFSRIAKPFIGYSMAYSFNNPAGMCPTCQGLGHVTTINEDALLDMDRSLSTGAIRFPTFQPGGWRLTRYTDSGFFDNDLPLRQWESGQIELLLHGEECRPPSPATTWHKTATYIGVIARITKSFLSQDTGKYHREIDAVTETRTCPDCTGTRLNKEARSALIGDVGIADCSSMSIDALGEWLHTIHESSVTPIIDELVQRIGNLTTVGLGYLSLGRSTTTLSGGESQRLKLANYLNSPLSDVLYIFDEPSVGLHPHDLIGVDHIFESLRDKSNTVVIVDHDPQVMAIADHIIDLGPGSGTEGGNIMFQGTFVNLVRSATATGEALRHPGTLRYDSTFKEYYDIHDITKHNLCHVSARIPKHALTAVTGVAGSGKSTLVQYGLARDRSAIVLNQRPIHASSRSNALTYLGVFDALRRDFAKVTRQSAAMFSFNGKGACPICKGKGQIILDIAYLGETSSTCEACGGERYNTAVLSLKNHGLNIAQALHLSPRDARLRYPKILGHAMRCLEQVGLDYLSIGQSLNTLSGGELQRLRLARVLMQETGHMLILDEPTSGLHESNIQQLCDLLRTLIDSMGMTVVVIEHNLRIIGQSDWVIDMGPGAGIHGGNVLFQGPPEVLMTEHDTQTARFMRNYFAVDRNTS